MTQRILRSVISALGATTINCIWLAVPLISPSHRAIYHWSGRAGAIFVPVAIEFIVVWAVSSLLLFVAQGQGLRPALALIAVVAFLPWGALKSFAVLVNRPLEHPVSRSLFAFCAILFLLISFYLKSHRSGISTRQRKTILDALGIVAPAGVIVIIQLVWFGWQGRHLNAPLPLHQTLKHPTIKEGGHPRVIWIVLDELSYQQVYGHRFHGLSLPTFDRLTSEATVFTNVAPAGLFTEIVVPSLLSGRSTDKIQSSPDGLELKIHSPVTDHWEPFNQYDTIFSDALAAGYSTGVAGWYIPYCRVLPQVLDRCSWVFDEPQDNGMMPRASIMGNLFSKLTSLNAGDRTASTHLSDYQQIFQSGDRLLEDPSSSFILIHMAAPHPPGIYNRAKHFFATRDATYLDNLALADMYLSHVRSLLCSSGQWDSSVVIIMGDHSWRTQIWSKKQGFTPEEREASGQGEFDDRPGYIVKLPKQRSGAIICTRFSAVHTRRLFQAIMGGRIITPADLSTWVDRMQQIAP